MTRDKGERVPITKERIKLLDNIGFDWNSWHGMKIHCGEENIVIDCGSNIFGRKHQQDDLLPLKLKEKLSEIALRVLALWRLTMMVEQQQRVAFEGEHKSHSREQVQQHDG